MKPGSWEAHVLSSCYCWSMQLHTASVDMSKFDFVKGKNYTIPFVLLQQGQRTFVSSGRSSYSDSGLLEVRKTATNL